MSKVSKSVKAVKSTPGAEQAAAGQVPAGMGIDIGISAKDRAAVALELSKLLADSYTLYLTTHNFHWNVTGPLFNTLHEMFMTQYTEQWQALDDIAERIRALGHYAPFSLYADRVFIRRRVGPAPPSCQSIHAIHAHPIEPGARRASRP